MVTSLLSRDGRNMWDQITDEGRKHLSKARWLSCHRWSNPGLMVWWGPESFYFSLDNRHNIRLFTQRNFVLENLGKTKTLICNSVFIRLVPLWFSFDFGKVCFHTSHLCLGWLDALHDSLLVYWSHLDLGGSCAEPVISYTFAWKTDLVFILNCIAFISNCCCVFIHLVPSCRSSEFDQMRPLDLKIPDSWQNWRTSGIRRCPDPEVKIWP